MELATFDTKRAYWLQRGWGQRAPIKTISGSTVPAHSGRVRPDSPITGIAWAHTQGIDKVEVHVDHGQWQPAELSTEVNI
ncbi:MAG TPA: hypothetical protein VN748_12415 [Pseudonocardiaceae bacterium]|jgi:hypothetical protein|nr:hypothetical protein [Pseudonocardiaceae bacterium]